MQPPSSKALPQIQDLIDLAQAALAQNLSQLESLERAAAYSEAFQHWIESNPKFDELELTALQELNNLHATILDGAQKLQEQTSADLRTLRTRAKGILAYADVLPRRISTLRVKKG